MSTFVRAVSRGLNADWTECWPPKAAVSGRNADPSHTANHHMTIQSVDIPAVRHSDTGRRSPLRTFIYRLSEQSEPKIGCSRKEQRPGVAETIERDVAEQKRSGTPLTCSGPPLVIGRECMMLRFTITKHHFNEGPILSIWVTPGA